MPQLIFSPEEPRVLVLAILSTTTTAYLLTVRNKTRDLRFLLAAFTCWSVYFLISVCGEAVYPKSDWYPIAAMLVGLLGLALFLGFAYHFLGEPYPTEARVGSKLAGLVVAVCCLILIVQMLTHKAVTWSVGSGAGLLLFAWAETVFFRRSLSAKTKPECTAHRQFAEVFLLSALAVAVYFLGDMGKMQPGAIPLISGLLYLCTLLGFALVYVNHAPQATTVQVKIIGVSLFTMLAALTIVGSSLSPALNKADDLDLATRLTLQNSIVSSMYSILGSTAFILLAFPRFFRRSLINPLNALVGAVHQVAQGARDVQIPVLFNDEIGRLTANFNRMTQSLKAAEDEISMYTKSLEAKVNERTTELRIRNEENERLLLNILPSSIAERLKRGERIIADACSETTILFADIVGFTNLSTRVSAGELVSLLSDLFSEFDELARQYGVEKIKTIGDAYMAVAGLPESRPDHALAAMHVAERMLQVCQQRKDKNGNALQLRIGINSGPVIAGVIGTHKFAYDLWGDTVNTASRMESHGRPGRIQVTEATYALLRDQYEFESCGEQQIKGKGVMATYLLAANRSTAASAV